MEEVLRPGVGDTSANRLSECDNALLFTFLVIVGAGLATPLIFLVFGTQSCNVRLCTETRAGLVSRANYGFTRSWKNLELIKMRSRPALMSTSTPSRTKALNQLVAVGLDTWQRETTLEMRQYGCSKRTAKRSALAADVTSLISLRVSFCRSLI